MSTPRDCDVTYAASASMSERRALPSPNLIFVASADPCWFTMHQTSRDSRSITAFASAK